MKLSRFAFLLGLAACAHASLPVGVAACANLRRLGCPEGENPACAVALDQAVTEHHVLASGVSCMADAPTRAAAVACAPAYMSCGTR